MQFQYHIILYIEHFQMNFAKAIIDNKSNNSNHNIHYTKHYVPHKNKHKIQSSYAYTFEYGSMDQ